MTGSGIAMISSLPELLMLFGKVLCRFSLSLLSALLVRFEFDECIFPDPESEILPPESSLEKESISDQESKLVFTTSVLAIWRGLGKAERTLSCCSSPRSRLSPDCQPKRVRIGKAERDPGSSGVAIEFRKESGPIMSSGNKSSDFASISI